MAVPSAAAEVAIKKLARVGGNTICPNCGTEKKFGFGTVCMKYLTFVCNECKSSHQAISHRCKSLTMSSWTDGEILQIRTVGGNDRARATWLASAPPPGQNGRPAPGSSIDVYKSFIVDVYERKKYFRESTDNDGNYSAAPESASVVAQRQPQRLETRAPVPAQPPVQPTPPPPPVVADLLDFGTFDNVSQPVVPITTTSSVASTNMFGEFTMSTAATPVTAPIFDPFTSNTATTASIAAPSNAPAAAVDVYGTAATTNPSLTSAPAMSNSFGNFDPFGAGCSGLANGSMASMSTGTATKPPIMNNAAMNSSNNIGMMMGNMNANNAIGGSIMMNQPMANKNGNMMMGNNNIMGSTGAMNNYGGFANNTIGTTNMYGNGMNNNIQSGMMMNGFSQPPAVMMMGPNTGMNMGTNVNATNNRMGMMNNNSGMMMSNTNNNNSMMMNGFQSNFNQSNGSFMTMNGNSSSMGVNHSTTAKNISTNFGTNNASTKHDPFANLGL